MKQFMLKILCFLFLLITVHVNAQDRIQKIETQLKSMVVDQPGLEEKAELSVNGVSIQEFVRGIAIAHKLNVSVDPQIELRVVNNFSNATVLDVLVFLCKEHNLDINFTGSIISIVPFDAPPKPVEPKKVKEIKVDYDLANDWLSLDLKNDTLWQVAKTIVKKSMKNVVFKAQVKDQLVNCYIERMPFEKALENFALANELELNQTEDGVYVLDKPVQNTKSNGKNKGNIYGNKKGSNTLDQQFSMSVDENNLITIEGEGIELSGLIKQLSKELDINYYLVSEISGNTTVNVKQTTYDQLLDHVLQGTDYTYEKDQGIYIIGERKEEGLRHTKVIQLQHRTVEKIIEFIPADLKQNVDIKEFVDLNSLILSGSEPRIEEIQRLLKDIDKVVPVVLIEVMIVDYSNKRTNTTGVNAGLGDAPTTTGGTVFPGLNMTLNSESVNDLIESFNGFGVVNLGKVTPNFYMTISALESQGILRVKSTPKLSTLNGHEASMSIGNTEYYYEQTNNVITNQSTQNIITKQYKSVSADLSVKVKPFVSGDDQITLEVSVQQSDFTERISQDAPPGTVSRDFTSLIRVKDQEMILLGGLEEKAIRDAGSGVPFLSRIPVIKWFFSSRSREKSKSKLNIFIKPTVIY